MSGLTLHNVSMRFDLPNGSFVQALENVSLDMKAGELLSVLGPSGCGKTTLLNILAGFLAQTSGELKLHGRDIHGPDAERGMVFQKGALFEWMGESLGVVHLTRRFQSTPRKSSDDPQERRPRAHYQDVRDIPSPKDLRRRQVCHNGKQAAWGSDAGGENLNPNTKSKRHPNGKSNLQSKSQDASDRSRCAGHPRFGQHRQAMERFTN